MRLFVLFFLGTRLFTKLLGPPHADNGHAHKHAHKHALEDSKNYLCQNCDADSASDELSGFRFIVWYACKGNMCKSRACNVVLASSFTGIRPNTWKVMVAWKRTWSARTAGTHVQCDDTFAHWHVHSLYPASPLVHLPTFVLHDFHLQPVEVTLIICLVSKNIVSNTVSCRPHWDKNV